MRRIRHLIHCGGSGDPAVKGWLDPSDCTFIWRSFFGLALTLIGSGVSYLCYLLVLLTFQLHDLPRDLASINDALDKSHREIETLARGMTTTKDRVLALETIFRNSRPSDGRYIPLPPGAELTEPWNRDRK